jgi:hypothetical protein
VVVVVVPVGVLVACVEELVVGDAVGAGTETDVVVVSVAAGGGLVVVCAWRAGRRRARWMYHGVGARRCECLSTVSTPPARTAGPEVEAVRVSAGRVVAGDRLGELDEQAVTNAAAAPRQAART